MLTVTGGFFIIGIASIVAEREDFHLCLVLINFFCGALFVDEIGCLSVTMISTASMELANSANTELSWKKVTKGFRSASRRPRKINRSLNMNRQHNDKGSEEEDEPSVTESEEFGLEVLGHHFSEKRDHLPIKKRRPARQSLSPPCIPFDQWCGEAGVLDDLLPLWTSGPSDKSVVNKKPLCSADSYGIELLAAAACSTGMDDEIPNVKAVKVENFEALSQSHASIIATSVEENIMCSQEENSLLNDIKSDACVDLREQNNSPSASGDIHNKSDTEAGKSSSSGKDVRLHWDLNTVMDEWEQPPEKINTNSPRNGSVDVLNEGLRGGEIEKLEGSARHGVSEHAWELLKCPSEVEASACVISESKCPDSGLFPGSVPIPGESPFKENINLSTSKMTVIMEENHSLSSDLQLGQTLAVENVQLGKQDTAMANPTISEKNMCDVVRMKFNEDTLSELSDGMKTTNLMGTTLDVEDLSCKLGNAGPSFEKGKDLAGKLDINVPLPIGSLSEIELKKLELKPFEHFGELSEDLLDNGDGSDYSPGGHHHLGRIEKMSKYQSGCESPVEDGELRESIVRSWQENEDGTDRIDCNMDDRDAADDFSVGNHCTSAAGFGGDQVDNGKLPEKVVSGKSYSSKESSRSIPEGHEHVAKKVEATNVKLGGDVGAFDLVQKVDVTKSQEENVRSGATRVKLSTRLQGSSASGAFDGKDARDVQRSFGVSFKDGQMYRSDKYVEKNRLFPQMQDGSPKNNQNGDVSGNWDCRHHYQNGYRRGGGNRSQRRSNLPDVNDCELAHDDHRSSGSNYLRSGYRPLVRRRPPDDNHHSMNRVCFVTRDTGQDRSRGRSGLYRREFVKENRDEFHDPIADFSAPSSVWVRDNHSARRQWSTSPIYNRDTSFSRPGRKSRSRSRTGSPVPWHLQRERIPRTRQISRSPDFRSEGRMIRNRMHYDDPKFLDNGDGFLSPPRRGFFNDRNIGPTRYRDRNSPGRYFAHRQRFGSNGSIGRTKTDDDGFRPRNDDGFRRRLNSERFSEQSGGGWRGHNNNNYDGSDNERTKFNNKHEMIRRVRHSDMGGAGRRFRGDADDCFENHYTHNKHNYNSNNNSNNICIRSIEKSDVPVNSREEGRSHFKYDGDRMYTTTSKLPGIRDYEDDMAISRG